MSGLTSQQDELVLLRKRARRRLIGAIVMSLVASGVMLRVLDSKPQHEMRPETVDIVSNLPSDSKPATKPAVPAGEASTTPAAGAQASAKPDSAPAVAPEAAASANAAPASAAAPAASLPAAPPPRSRAGCRHAGAAAGQIGGSGQPAVTSQGDTAARAQACTTPGAGQA